jgi:TnpA family transposase
VLRLGTSIRSGTVTASAILKRLSAYPRQNGLAVALRELGRIERTLFTLEWFKNIDLRRRTSTTSTARMAARRRVEAMVGAGHPVQRDRVLLTIAQLAHHDIGPMKSRS